MSPGTAAFIRLRPVSPQPDATPGVNLDQIEEEGIKLTNVAESLKDLNNGMPVYGYAIGVQTSYFSEGVLVYIPAVDPFALSGASKKETK